MKALMPMNARMHVRKLIYYWETKKHTNGLHRMHGELAALFGFDNYEDFKNAHGYVKICDENIHQTILMLLGPHGHALYCAMKIRRGL